MPQPRNHADAAATPGRPQHAVVIGAGLAGLAAAYDLARAGVRVTLIEGDAEPGGLAASLRIEDQRVERFYHFICRSDRHLLEFVDELGLRDEVEWQGTRTSFYRDGRHFPFGTPLDLLRFSAVPWNQRIRVGVHALRSRYRRTWQQLDGIAAKPWLIDTLGREAYEAIWHPLLSVKFGAYHDRISAAWVWHRIWRVATSRRRLWGREMFGYLRQGSATLVDPLARRLTAHPEVAVRLGVRVGRVEIDGDRVAAVHAAGERVACDAVLSTVALPTLNRLVPDRSDDYFRRTRAVEYIGVVCALFSLRRPFSRSFWMNIDDPRISFNGVIEMTNLNRHLRAAGLHLLYVPHYLPTDAPRYRMDDAALVAEIIPMLRLINPELSPEWIKEWHVSRTPHAQAVCLTGFAGLRPDIRASVRGLYVTDSTQFYPEDRTLSAAIRQGRLAARAIVDDAAVGSIGRG